MKIVILHGLGQAPSDWSLVVEKLGVESTAINIFKDITFNTQVSLEILSKRVNETLNELKEPYVLVGLSLGGLLALNYVSHTPSQFIKGLIVCGAVYKSAPRTITLMQNLYLKFIPQNKLAEIGFTKKQILDLITSINQIDLTKDLEKIELPTLTLCGSKDRFNVKSSREINYLISNSSLVFIQDGLHELNKSNPNELSEIIKEFSKKLK